jgi:mRNA-degrading endonuclease YafQ of YafQ-DinJ toxin-antitoxin module
MPDYEAVFVPTFAACMRDHPDQRERLQKLVQRLQSDPYQAAGSHALTAKERTDLRGKRGAHLSRNFVVIFMVCEECVNRGHRAKGYNQCEPCPEAPLKRIIFLAFGPHKKAYGHTWGG